MPNTTHDHLTDQGKTLDLIETMIANLPEQTSSGRNIEELIAMPTREAGFNVDIQGGHDGQDHIGVFYFAVDGDVYKIHVEPALKVRPAR